ncbi:hypothetical protein HP439_09935 [Sphingobacterium shayense]|uniref:hypothetical protein n=1 Tax=Sphingobacterium shayense TaxID=626343 RepID=UPI00155593A5|nr:hypothetical protein [Sphingobacterium shayense]NQD71037.1 hypothetical protein [Sphingobacterium shayense]
MDIEDLISGGASRENEKGVKSPLKSLKLDLDFYADSIKEVSNELIAEGYTKYPIFVAHQHEISVGELLLDRKDLQTQWSINVSSLEEFLEVGIIKEERKDYFIKHFKKPENFMCLFVVVPEGANFVFYPYVK